MLYLDHVGLIINLNWIMLMNIKRGVFLRECHQIKIKKNFNKFYKMIKNREYTTAMLQEFLFFNKKKETIFDIMDEFYEIIENNKPDHFEKKMKNTCIIKI